ncbi:MAG TPA: hypothetical protein VN756_01725 [Solirubrobacterales bacterium]|nr:hypothetical protein [Solirubrobacterales bacterium]
MTHTLKWLAISITAAFALVAIAAPLASAAKFKTEEPPTALTADPMTPLVFEPTPDGEKKVTCQGLAATGTMEGKESEALTIVPTFSKCKIKIGAEEKDALVTMNGCDFNYTSPTAKTENTAGEHAKLHIICPAGKEIEIEVGPLGTKCIDIPGQTMEGIHYENTLNNGIFDVDAKATVHNLKTTTTHTAACPTKSGLTETHETGRFTGEITLKGDNAAKEPKSLRYE